MAKDYERAAEQERQATRVGVARALGLKASDVRVSRDSALVTLNVDQLYAALNRINARAEAKTAGELMDEADVTDSYEPDENDYQPGARTLFPSLCPDWE